VKFLTGNVHPARRTTLWWDVFLDEQEHIDTEESAGRELAMNALMLVLLALAALAARTIQLRLRFSGWEVLWRFRSGPVTVELRRHAELARLGGDAFEFPQPREFRVVSMRVGGIPVWSQQAIAGLPATTDERIGHIPAAEFDHLFASQFRLTWPRRRVRLAVRAH
jgi:hypothetical protein